ncbi:SpoIIE family protein phosphatase [Pseudonocardia sp. CA-142604]|uniref:SpoIIE family protein phosphatase n=1 Tax=Pseudonocardia sp. CA-142604 TaxID=3240024 RepID=UPI003D8E06A9
MDQLSGRRHHTDPVLHAVPIGVVVLDESGLVREVNPVAAALLGRSVPELLGADLHAVMHEAGGHEVPSCPFRPASTALDSAAEQILRPDGTTVDVRCRIEPLVEDGMITGSVVAIDPVVESAVPRGDGSRDRFLACLERALQPLEDPDEIMATVARLLGEHMEVDRSVYAEAEPDENHFTITGSYARGLPELTGRMAMSDFSADALRCMRAGVPYVLADAETDPRVLPEQRRAHHRAGFTAVIWVPLQKSGRFVAAMAVQHRTPRLWSDSEIDLLTTVVGRCWESLQRAHALGAVRESEEHFRLIVERAGDAIWLADDTLHFIDVNEAACALLGHSREELLTLGAADVVRPEDVPRLDALVAKLHAGASVTEVWEMRRKDGGTVPVELSMRSATDGRLQAIGRDITERRSAEAERERLLRREQETNRQLQLLQRATAALSAAATPAQVGAAVVEQLSQLVGGRSVAAWKVRGAGDLEALAVADWPPELVRRWSEPGTDAAGPVIDAATGGRPLWLDGDTAWAGHDPGLREELQRFGFDALACLPLSTAGHCLGLVTLALPPGRVLGAIERATAESLAEQCAQALYRAGLLHAERVARRAAEELSSIVAALSGATRPAEVADVVLDHAIGLGAESAVLVLHEGAHLVPIAGRGPEAIAAAAVALDAPDALATVVRTGVAEWSGSPIAVPLVLSDRTIGAVGLWFAPKDGAVPELPAEQRGAVLTVAGQCAQALDRARLHQAEHEVADVLQRSLLPRELPTLARLAAAAQYMPAAEHSLSGGDWYDMLPLDGTRVALVVGDVVGHGPAAAAVMGQLRSALATQLLDGHSPAAALERLDRFADRVPGSAGSTCACLTFDWATGELRWALAGHPPVLLVDDAGARFLDTGASAVLGVRGRPPYRERSAMVAPGASVILYTDGLVERRDEVVDTGLDRLQQAAERLADHGPDELARGLVEAVLGEEGPADDVALLVVRAIPAPLHRRLTATASSMSPLRRSVSEWASTAGLPEETTEDLELAVSEAGANAAEHAYPEGGGHFEYTVARADDGAVEVHVHDQGRWRPVPADNGHRGHGLRVIDGLVEEFVIDRGNSGTRVSFRLPAPPPSAAPGPLRPPAYSTARAPEPASVEERHGPDGERVLAVLGDMDLAGRGTVGEALFEAAGLTGPLVLDLTGVGYLSSAGVAVLAEASAIAGDGLSIVVASGSAPARVLELTGLADALPVVTAAPTEA